MSKDPDGIVLNPEDPVRVTIKINSRRKHVVLGIYKGTEDGQVRIRPACAYSEVWFPSEDVLSIEPSSLVELQPDYPIPRYDHPLPETIRKHLVQHHGYTIDSVDHSSATSLLEHHDTVLHRPGKRLSHVHGLTQRERDLVDQINRKDHR